MDYILRNAHVVLNGKETEADIGIEDGRIAGVQPNIQAQGRELDVNNRLVSPGFVETHIHLDKSCILDRCKAERGDLDEAIEQTAAAKLAFTAEDVYERGARTLEKAILNGTTHMRTHLELDPGVSLRSQEGILPLVEDCKWASDLDLDYVCELTDRFDYGGRVAIGHVTKLQTGSYDFHP